MKQTIRHPSTAQVVIATSGSLPLASPSFPPLLDLSQLSGLLRNKAESVAYRFLNRYTVIEDPVQDQLRLVNLILFARGFRAAPRNSQVCVEIFVSVSPPEASWTIDPTREVRRQYVSFQILRSSK